MEGDKFEALQEKTKTKYRKVYEDFKEHVTLRDLKINEATVTDYILAHCAGKSASLAWSMFSMLRLTIQLNDGINIGEYKNLLTFLKQNAKTAYKDRKKPCKLEEEEVEKFLSTAPDYDYLACKVALVMGLCGGLNREEISNLRVWNMDEKASILLVRCPRGKNEHMFAVTGDYLEYYRKYARLRPAGVDTDRFFLKYSKGKCAKQVIGINKVGQMPKEIAHFLGLPDPDSYTSHAFRWSKTKARCKAVENTRNLSFKKARWSLNMSKKFQSDDQEDHETDELESHFISPIVEMREGDSEYSMNEPSKQISGNSESEASMAGFSRARSPTPTFVGLSDNYSYVDPLTRDDLKDHIPEVNKSTYLMGKICAACKWSIQLYYNLDEQQDQIANDNGSSLGYPVANQPTQISNGCNRYLEPGPHFSPTFTAGDDKELKWEVRLDCVEENIYVRINFIELKHSTRYDYKIAYLRKDLQEQVIKDFSNEYSNDQRTRECMLPKGLHLRFAKSTLVLIVRIVAEADCLSTDPIKMEIPDEREENPLDDEIPEESKDLENMFRKGLLTDATLVVEGQNIATHKYILAARSQTFLEMFINGEQSVNPEIEIEDLSYEAAREMMRFLYTGKLRDIEEENAKQLLVVASKYQMKLLFPKCEKILSECLSNENAVDLYKLAETYEASKLQAKAKEFLVQNIKNIPGDLISTLDSRLLTQILLNVTKTQS